MVPRHLKTLRTRMRRRLRPAWEKAKAELDMVPKGSEERAAPFRRWNRIDHRWSIVEEAIWRRMKRAAIERATGI